MISTAVLASGCSQLPCPGQRVEAFSLGDLNPLKWLGNAASAAVGDVWLSAMTGLWSAALWLLKLAFQIIDAFTTPDLSASGPMGSVLPTTLWLGATLAVIMMFVQLTVALIRRDGEIVAPRAIHLRAEGRGVSDEQIDGCRAVARKRVSVAVGCLWLSLRAGSLPPSDRCVRRPTPRRTMNQSD
jgi:hypothetical protein